MMQNNNNNGRKTLIDRTLPWDNLPGDRLRKNSIFVLLLLLSFILIILIEMAPVQKKDRREEQEIPERLAELVMERKKKEEPPPPPEPEEEEPEEEPEEEEPEEEEPEPEPEPEPEKEVEQAREKAKKELEVFDDQLAGLRDLAPTPQRPENLRRGGAESAKIERNLITIRAGQGSGGIQTSTASSGGGGGGSLEAGQMAQVESSVAEKGQSASETRTTEEGKSQRTRQQIRRVFDQYGGRLYSIYARALRKNPALQGTVTFDLEIAPSGEVTAVSIKSSELGDPGVEQKLLLIVKTFDFGALPVEPWKGDYTVNFFPR